MNSKLGDVQELLSNSHFKSLCDEFRRNNFDTSTKTFYKLLSQITRLSGIQWLGWYHTQMVWDNSTAAYPDIPRIVANHRNSNAWQVEMVAACYVFLKGHIPRAPKDYAFPVWDLNKGWEHEQWQSQVTVMTGPESQAACHGLDRKIYVKTVKYPEYVDKGLIDRIFAKETTRNKQTIPEKTIEDVHIGLACMSRYFWPLAGMSRMTNALLKTGFHYCFPHFIFGLLPTGDHWIYDEEKEWTETPVFFYEVETAGNNGFKKYNPKSDWMVANSQGLPLIISETISGDGRQDHRRLCHQAIALLKLIYYAVHETVLKDNPMRIRGSFAVKNMALFTSLIGVSRYVFSFMYPDQDIKACYKFFSFTNPSDMADLWLELLNARDSFANQFEGDGIHQLMEVISNIRKDHTSTPALRGTRSRSTGVGRSSNSPSPAYPANRSLDHDHPIPPNLPYPNNPPLNYMPASGPSNYLQPPTGPYYSSSRRH